MHVEPIDLGQELRQRVQFRLEFLEVVVGAPVASEFCIVASCTPCEASTTVSRSGHLVAFMRLRNSVSSASGTLKRKGRTAGVVSLI
jgi:hypothetical protein